MGVKRYKKDDYATVKCSCGNDVKFKPGEIFKYCDKCGERYNKMRIGCSIFDYGSVMSRELREKIGNAGPWYFILDAERGNGSKVITIMEAEITGVSGFANAPKAKVEIGTKVMSLEVADYSETDDIDHASVSIRNFGNENYEIDEETIYSIERDKLIENIYRKFRPLYGKEVSKIEYIDARNKILDMRLRDIVDKYRPRKKKRKGAA